MTAAAIALAAFLGWIVGVICAAEYIVWLLRPVFNAGQEK